MGGVDVRNQNRSYYSTQIATKKWWHCVYFFYLDSYLANAFTIYKKMSKKLETKAMTHKEFQLRISYSLIGRPFNCAVAERTTGHVCIVSTSCSVGPITHVARGRQRYAEFATFASAALSTFAHSARRSDCAHQNASSFSTSQELRCRIDRICLLKVRALSVLFSFLNCNCSCSLGGNID